MSKPLVTPDGHVVFPVRPWRRSDPRPPNTRRQELIDRQMPNPIRSLARNTSHTAWLAGLPEGE